MRPATVMPSRFAAPPKKSASSISGADQVKFGCGILPENT
jgi:hypothetical protein